MCSTNICNMTGYSSVVFNPTLSYISQSSDTSDRDSIVKVCKSCYAGDELKAAKEALWANADKDALPTLKQRKGAPANDKNIEDIINAMKSLDEANHLPTFAVNACDLGRIPSVIPTETCSISVCERLNVLEKKFAEIKDLEGRVKTNEDKLNRIPSSYSAAVTSNVCTTRIPTPP